MTKVATKTVHILCMTLAAALFEAFFLLSVFYFKGEWGAALYLAVLILGTLLNAALLIGDVVFCIFEKQLIMRAAVTAYLFFGFFALLVFILIKTGFFEVVRDEEKFEEFLQRSGSWMAALFVLLQFLQVVVLPIPSTVTVVAGAALFGPFVGSLLSLLGIVLGSLVAFLIGRYAGYPVVAWLIGESTLKKWLNKIKGKDKLMLSAMFILPVFPDDVLCFVAGISSMSVWFFLAVILLSRVLAVFTTSYSVTLIPFNTWWGLLIWGVIVLLVIALFIVLYKKSDEILNWFYKKFHRETRVSEKTEQDEFTLNVVSPDGNYCEKGVKKQKDVPPENPSAPK